MMPVPWTVRVRPGHGGEWRKTLLRTAVRWTLAALLAAVGIAVVVWGVAATRAERQRESEMERPIAVPRRLSRSAAGDVVVRIDADGQSRLGIQVEPLAAASVPDERSGSARILDPGPLIGQHEEIAAADAQLNAARAEHERAKALLESVKGVSRAAVEVAAANLVSRESTARAAARRLVNAWGKDIAALAHNEREALIERLVSRQAAIARVDLPAGEDFAGSPSGVAVAPLAGDGSRVQADRVFAAPNVDPDRQGRSFFALFEAAPPALRPGAVVAAHVQASGESRAGVLIPRSAVIRFEGLTWVYVQGAPDKFFRRDFSSDHRLENGWFAVQGFTAGDGVVVTGAEALLSEELRYQIQLEEE